MRRAFVAGLEGVPQRAEVVGADTTPSSSNCSPASGANSPSISVRMYMHRRVLLCSLVAGVGGCDSNGAAPEEQESGGSSSEPDVADPEPPPYEVCLDLVMIHLEICD